MPVKANKLRACQINSYNENFHELVRLCKRALPATPSFVRHKCNEEPIRCALVKDLEFAVRNELFLRETFSQGNC
jgi:hypothetical protein